MRFPHRRNARSVMADLADPREHRRLNAAIWIWSRDSDSFSEQERTELIQALQPVATSDGSVQVRSQAVAALTRLRAPGAADLALAALHDPDPVMRSTVAAELGPLDDSRLVDQLITLLHDADGFVREGAALALTEQGDIRAIEPLQAMLDRREPDAAARAAAKRAIAALKAR